MKRWLFKVAIAIHLSTVTYYQNLEYHLVSMNNQVKLSSSSFVRCMRSEVITSWVPER